MHWLRSLLFEIGSMAKFNFQIFKTLTATCRKRTVPAHGTPITNLILTQLTQTAWRSFLTVCFAGLFVGAILMIQFQLMLQKYDALSLLGGLNTSGNLREVGPLIISFLLAGKVGAFTAAELGTMRVTEQIDAIRCLGTNPLEYLIVPRFISILFCSVLLLLVGLVVGIAGSIVVAHFLYNINYLQYLESVPQFLSGWTIGGSIFKSIVYGWIVAIVSTYKGFHAAGGAKGVGIAVTHSAIYTNLFIVLANSFTSYIIDSVQELVYTLRGLG